MSLNLIFVVHNHQPVGNFDFVFAQAADDAYLPFLRLLLEYPELKIGLHTSGCLWDWFIHQRPEYIELARELISRGQVEILGGAYYEPILSLIPPEDIKSQFARMDGFITETFGVEARGFWCAERVWEPALPFFLKDTGKQYTLLDDNHFLSSGFSGDSLNRPYRTSHLGSSITIFPISERMRYLIPFGKVSDIEDYLRPLAGGNKRSVVIFGDDGEKFGMWPGTEKWVWREGWMKSFFEMLMENKDWLKTIHPAEYLERFPPSEEAFLPATSYREMTGWALPAPASRDFETLWNAVKDDPSRESERRFLRGGHFENFLAKYPESARMHREMLYVSGILREHAGKLEKHIVNEANKLLHQGQCNCAYWHGVFGGLYLNYLRHAVYRNLLAAKRLIKDRLGSLPDGSAPGFARLSGSGIEVELDLNSGTVEAVDYLPAASRITDVLSRKYEAYHDKIDSGTASHGTNESTGSIHEKVGPKEGGLIDVLVYDRRTRRSFDVFLVKPGVDAAALAGGRVHYLDSSESTDWSSEIEKGNAKLEGRIDLANDSGFLIAEKIIEMEPGKPAIRCKLRLDLTNLSGKLSAGIGIEWNFGLMAGNAPDRYYEYGSEKKPLISLGSHTGTGAFHLVDEWQGFRITIESGLECTFFYYPIETVSASEGGLERTYQGSSVVLYREEEIAAGAAPLEWEFMVSISPV